MEPIRQIRSRTAVLPSANIDTDQIIPARFLRTTVRAGLGGQLFADWRYDVHGTPRAEFALNQPAARGCEILVAGRNFGCGSSREHAPWALLDYGFRAVISTEIADIFCNNSLKNGLLPVVVDEAGAAWLLANPGAEVTVDLEGEHVSLPGGRVLPFKIERFARYCLLNGIDELGYLRSQEPAIAQFEGASARLAGPAPDMKAAITVIAGDGIGPEVTAEAVGVLRTVARNFGHEFTLREAPFGGIAIDLTGDPLPPATLDLCLGADAVLLGAIGGPKWSAPQAPVRPEQGLLRLRKELGVYANLRPVSVHPALRDVSTLKSEVLDGVDLLFVRELTGGIYFGARTRTADAASDLCSYSVGEVERIVRVAARLARCRRGRLTSIDKANVLETSRLWRAVAERVVCSEFPDVQLDHMLVDSAAMHLIRRPRDFDVAVTENMFGDILTDEASMLAGSLGLLPSASLGEGRRGLYEPIHGSAPDIAGKGIANPFGAILSAALLLRHSLGLEAEAAAVEAAVAAAIGAGVRTPDIAATGTSAATTHEAGAAVTARLGSAFLN